MSLAHYAIQTMAPKAKAFEEATKDPMKIQMKLLFEFLKRNEKTEYGNRTCNVDANMLGISSRMVSGQK